MKVLRKVLNDERNQWEQERALMQSNSSSRNKNSTKVMNQMREEMSKALMEAREREEEANRALMQAEIDVDRKKREMERRVREESDEMVSLYKKQVEEARQQAEAEREASQLQTMEMRREMLELRSNVKSLQTNLQHVLKKREFFDLLIYHAPHSSLFSLLFFRKRHENQEIEKVVVAGIVIRLERRTRR